MGKPTKRDELPLHPITAYETFDKWGMDFIGPIDLPSNKKNYIIVCTNYLTKWAEVKALREANETAVVEFLNENIFTRFGVSREIVADQGTRFNSKMVQELMKKNKVQHKQSTPYHYQANGQLEVTNRELEIIMTKTVQLHRKDWANRLNKVIWAYNITQKTTIGLTPY